MRVLYRLRFSLFVHIMGSIVAMATSCGLSSRVPRTMWDVPGYPEWATHHWEQRERVASGRDFESYSIAGAALTESEYQAPFQAGGVVFERVFGHCIPPSDGRSLLEVIDAPTIWTLLDDSPVHRARYREYTISGRLETPRAEDETAYLKHCALMALARQPHGVWQMAGGGIVTPDLAVSWQLRPRCEVMVRSR